MPEQATPAPLLLRVEEAARMLQVGRNKIYQLAAAGEIPSLHIGRQLRIPEQELREWIRAQVAPSLSTDGPSEGPATDGMDRRPAARATMPR